MDVNSLFEGIARFWDTVYPILLVHIIFYFIYAFIFGPPGIRKKLQDYSASENFTAFKKMLAEFELWKRFPLILGIFIIVYFAVFNSAVNIVNNFQIKPFNVVYSSHELIKEYSGHHNLVTIALYSKSEQVYIWDVADMVNHYLEYYKTKFPEDYDSLVKWTYRESEKYRRYMNIALLLVIVLCVFFLRNMIKPRRKRSAIILRFMMVMLGVGIVCIYIRVKIEHAIEDRIMNEIGFVANHLNNDKEQQPVLSKEKQIVLEEKFRQHLEHDLNRNESHDLLWLSRYFEGNSIIEFICNKRPIRR
jgi:succinate dehydrogenase hydrophobic anchor subunit